MLEDVYVAGVGMHPFGKHGKSNKEMAYVAAKAALKDAGIKFRDVGALYNGYIMGDMTEGVAIAKDLGLTGVPVVHVENASATGSTAFREACLRVASGQAEIAMALGFDDIVRMGQMMMQMFAAQGPRIESMVLPAAFFAMWAVRRTHEYGTTPDIYARIAAKNWNHARYNPMAQRQSDHVVTAEEVLASKPVAYPHTTMMACATGGGAACAIVTNKKWAKKLANGRPLVRVLASQLQSEQYVDGHIFMGAVVGPSELTRTTSQATYEEAGLGPNDVSLVHVHDAFPIEELMYYELMGFCGDGEGDKLVLEGATEIGGRIPFSTDGGLIARGHPGGPTGLAQVWDATMQLRGEAGQRQVEDAHTALVHMMGAGSVCVMHMLHRENA
ncbi:MAG TPA: thiolase family protein [Candidatus Acidoferrales bacterium]|nr:thiolase family protein [Candidatus Acidoferrales bacterium]